MTFSVVLQRVRDGKTVVVPQDEPWDAEEDRTEWYWTEGNMGCDCNLAVEFARGEGQAARASDRVCGNSAYRLIEFRLANGTVVPCQKPNE